MKFFLYVFLNVLAKCDEIIDLKSKKPLPFFRRQVEEVTDDTSKNSKNDDPQSKMVSFLVKNVREIFNVDDNTVYPKVHETSTTVDVTTQTSSLESSSTMVFKSTIIFIPSRTTLTVQTGTQHTDDIMLFENISLTPMPFRVERRGDKFVVKDIITKPSKPTNLAKDFMLLGKAEIPLLEDEPALVVLYNDKESATENATMMRRSCIICNNIDVPECSFPKNKL